MSERVWDYVLLSLFKKTEGGDVLVASSKIHCPGVALKRVGYEPFTVDGTFARLRYECADIAPGLLIKVVFSTNVA